MASGSRDISQMVFIRNVASHLENYSFDFEMLQVLDEIDGTRTVAEVAAILGKQVKELKATFDKLYKQGLILSVQRKKSIAKPPAGTEPGGDTPDSAADSPTKQQGRVQPAQKNATPKKTVPKSPPPPQEDTPGKSPGGQPEPSPKQADTKPQVETESPLPEGNENAPKKRRQPNSSASSSETEPSQSSSPGIFERSSEKPKSSEDIFKAPERTTNPGDFFSISKTESETPDTPYVFTSPRSSSGNDPSESFSGLLNRDGSSKTTSGASAGDQGTTGAPENAKAIEYFEKGLDALQRKAYEEALIQFEFAIELDPENRLYRANIQRVKKILNPDI